MSFFGCHRINNVVVCCEIGVEIIMTFEVLQLMSVECLSSCVSIGGSLGSGKLCARWEDNNHVKGLSSTSHR